MSTMAETVKWRTTEPTMTTEEAARSMPCGLCGEPADCVHLYRDGSYQLSCPAHDAGGYYVRFDRAFGEHTHYGDDSIEGWSQHLEGRDTYEAWMAFLSDADTRRFDAGKGVR